MKYTQMWRLKQFTTYAFVLALAALFALGAYYAPALAQEETQPTVLTDIGEGDARILTSNWRTLTPGEQHTYSFEYDGTDQALRVWLSSIPVDGAIFQVWTSDLLAEVSEDPATEPLAEGSTVADPAGFTSWTGETPEPGTYFVTVSPTSDDTVQYLLNIASAGLAAEQPNAAAPSPAVPAATPTPTADPNIATVTTGALNVRQGPSTAYPVITAVPSGTQLTVLGRNELNTWINVQLPDGTEGWVTRSLTDYVNIAPVVETPPLPTATPQPGTTPQPTATPDPNVTRIPGDDIPLTNPMAAEELGGNWRTLDNNESHWYRFQHQGGDLPVHIWMDTDPNEGAGFRVYSEESAMAIMAGADPDDVNDIGRGTRNPVEPGYLFWRGVFEEAGPFYVRVRHGWTGPVNYSIYAAGPGLNRPGPATAQ